MFCPNCGSNNPDYAQSCGRCGAMLRSQSQPNEANQQPYSQPYAQQPYGYQQQPYGYQQPYAQNNQQPYGYNPNPFQPSVPMKWFKFLIYFLLFFTAFGNLVSAVSYFTGMLYINPYTLRNISDQVYMLFPGLQALDICMGVFSIFMAVFAIITRFRLSGFYKNAGNYVFAMYLISGGVSLIYSIVSYLIVGEGGVAMEGASTLITAFVGLGIDIAIALCNKTYFAKRKMFFQR